jgi:hypothetical protein
MNGNSYRIKETMEWLEEDYLIFLLQLAQFSIKIWPSFRIDNYIGGGLAKDLRFKTV